MELDTFLASLPWFRNDYHIIVLIPICYVANIYDQPCSTMITIFAITVFFDFAVKQRTGTASVSRKTRSQQINYDKSILIASGSQE